MRLAATLETLVRFQHGVPNYTINNMIIEIRASEGGDDAKLLVAEQVNIYSRLASRGLL